jgi:tetratricopeptide (TPR) repeat protein
MSLKELKRPDKILKAILEFLKYIKNNVKLLLGIGISIIAITAIFVVFNHVVEKREEKALNLLFSVNKQIEELDQNKNIEEIIKIMENVIIKMPNSNSKSIAYYYLAQLYYEFEKWDEAIKNYKLVENKASLLIKELALLGLAYSYEHKEEFDNSINAYEEILKNDKFFNKELSMINLARVYIKTNNKNKALEIINNFKIKYPNSPHIKMSSMLEGKTK